jgi:DUF1009 family protein
MSCHTQQTPLSSATPRAPRRVGLIAGWGRYPILVAQALRRQGIDVFCLGIAGHADPQLAEICNDFRYNGIAHFEKAIRYFHQQQVTDVTMAGKVHKLLMFQPWRWFKHLPDRRAIRLFFPHFWTRQKDCRDDSLLGAVVAEFAREGMIFGPATDYVPEVLVSRGQLTSRSPSAWQLRDIQFGWHLAKEMGRLDVGQSVAVKDQAVLAIEAVEGTDECIRRAGKLCPGGGFTIVKVAKPQQDMRYDVPTFGLGTLETLVAAGGSVLAIEAGRTILLDGSEAIDFANRKGLIVTSLDAAPL